MTPCATVLRDTCGTPALIPSAPIVQHHQAAPTIPEQHMAEARLQMDSAESLQSASTQRGIRRLSLRAQRQARPSPHLQRFQHHAMANARTGTLQQARTPPSQHITQRTRQPSVKDCRARRHQRRHKTRPLQKVPDSCAHDAGSYVALVCSISLGAPGSHVFVLIPVMQRHWRQRRRSLRPCVQS